MKTRNISGKMITLIVLSLFLTYAFAQQKTFTAYSLLEMKTVAEVAISPDNKYIAYTLIVPRQISEGAGSDYRDLYVYDFSAKTSKPLITDKKLIHGISWSPDGKNIVFKASLPANKGIQLYSISTDGGEIISLTKHVESIMQYQFYNNDLLYFTALSPQNEIKTDLLQKGFDMEIYEEECRDINLYELNLTDNNLRPITMAVSVNDFSVSPDGKRIVAAIASANLTDHSYMFKRIQVIDLSTLKMEKILENPGKLGEVRWSPDGKKIAFRSAAHVGDAVVGSLFIMDFPNNKTFKELENIVKDFRGSVISISWKDANTLYYASEEGLDISLTEYRLKEKKKTPIINAGQIVFSSFSHNTNNIAFAGNSPQHPNELFLFDLKKKELIRLTKNNPFMDNIKLAKQEKIVYNARDGLDIEGVLIYPLSYEKGQKYPLIVYIHGGPEAAIQNGWNTYYSRWGQIAAAEDFFVFLPNYRASSGRGVDFTMAGFGDLLGKEFDDVMDGIDHLIKNGMVDPNKVGIGGGSYGGYFAAWAATRHTERFAASVVFVGVSNQVSKRNTTDIPYEDYLVHWGFWSHENWDKVFEASPVKYAHQSKTPTLILHGKDDPRIPVSQGMELYRALKQHGHAPVRLVLYPGEGHGNRKNTSRLDYILRTMEWFRYYLKEDHGLMQMPEKYMKIKD